MENYIYNYIDLLTYSTQYVEKLQDIIFYEGWVSTVQYSLYFMYEYMDNIEGPSNRKGKIL